MSQYSDIEIIGFDLGHGETALTHARANNNEAPESLLIHNMKNQITAIAYHPSGKVIIGEEAFRLKHTTEFQIAFKKRPSSDPLAQETICKFVEAVYQVLTDEQRIQKGNHNHFFIGSPSGWNDDEIQAYEQLLSESGLPNVKVVKESRAALMHAKEGNLFILEQLKKSVLVIDVGSSTTDFTLVISMSDHPIDAGYDLGASLIDKAIFAKTLANHEARVQLEKIFEQQPQIRHRCEIVCRKVKEEYFNQPELYEEPNSAAGSAYENIQNKFFFAPHVHGAMIREIFNQPLQALKQKSWLGIYHEALEVVKQQLDKQGLTPSAILLTGSASKMYFVPEICKELFPDSPYKPDNEPELCIARGLARWGRVHIRTVHFMEEVNKFLDQQLERIVNYNFPALLDSVADTLADGLMEKVLKPRVRAWRRGDIRTLNGLEADIEQTAKNWLDSYETREQLKKPVLKWLKMVVLDDVENKTNPICQKYGLSPGTLVGGKNTVGFRADTGKFSGDIYIGDPTELTTIVGYVVTFVIGIVIALVAQIVIFAGPVGWIVGVVAAIVGFAAAHDWVRSTDLYLWIRKSVTDEKIEQLVQEKKPELREKIQEMLTQDPKVKNQFITPLNKWIRDAVKEQADKARLLIA